MNWAAASTIIAFLSICGAIYKYVRRRIRGRRIITYELLASVPFLRHVPGLESAGLSVIHNGEKLANPHLLQVQVVSKSAEGIATKDFDQGRPLSFDMGVPVVALLETTYHPDQPPLPEVTVTETGLQIRPEIIRSRQEMRFSVLADGPGARLACSLNPFLRYHLKEASTYQARQNHGMKLRQILGWAAVAFLAFYLLTQPAAAGHVVHNILEGLRGAGNSIANFFNNI